MLSIGLIGFVLTLLGPERLHRRSGGVVGGVVIAGFMVTSVVGTCMILAGRRRGARDVLWRAVRVCPRCRYPLPGMEAMGVCPECGEPYAHEETLEAWRARYPWLRL